MLDTGSWLGSPPGVTIRRCEGVGVYNVIQQAYCPEVVHA